MEGAEGEGSQSQTEGGHRPVIHSCSMSTFDGPGTVNKMDKRPDLVELMF